MKNNTPKEIWDKIKKSKNILTSLHANPDGDSLGSCVAMKYLIEQNTKTKVKIISHDPLDKALSELPYSKEIELETDITEIDPKQFDLLLILDTSDEYRIGKTKEKNYKLPRNNPIINIDHHDTNQYFGDINYNLENMASCCSVLFSLIKEWKIKIDKELAERLLLGICTDSGFFTNNNATTSIQEAAELISLGADYRNKILDQTYNKKPLNQRKYHALLITNAKIDKEKRLIYSSISQEQIKDLDLNVSEIRLGIKELKNVEGTEFCFTLVEIQEGIKGSFRSKRNIDVSLFAKALGGGGHKPAAAFILPKMPLEQAEKLVLDTIEKVGIHKSSE